MQGQNDSISIQSYSVPLVTYQPNTKNNVVIDVSGKEQQMLVIRKPACREPLAEHTFSLEKGKLIQNRSHTCDRSKDIETLKQSLVSCFENQAWNTLHKAVSGFQFPEW